MEDARVDRVLYRLGRNVFDRKLTIVRLIVNKLMSKAFTALVGFPIIIEYS